MYVHVVVNLRKSWSDEGITTKIDNKTTNNYQMVSCQSSHLTSFGVLVRISESDVSYLHIVLMMYIYLFNIE